MVTKVKEQDQPVDVETNDTEEHNLFVGAVRKVLLASIGAVALAQEEIDDFINRLIERGEIAEKDGKKLVREIMDKRRKDAENVEDKITSRVESVMDRMSVPSKADIDTLSEKINVLSKKIDGLK
jgi:poly(hydroxyalkanoate) granule-associated protein